MPSRRARPERARAVKRRWRQYQTESGRQPVKEFLNELSSECLAEVLAAMDEVAKVGLSAARHLRRDIYEARASCEETIVRILFAEEGQRGQVLLAVEGFVKKTRTTPTRVIDLAERRLADWRARGTRLRTQRTPRRR